MAKALSWASEPSLFGCKTSAGYSAPLCPPTRLGEKIQRYKTVTNTRQIRIKSQVEHEEGKPFGTDKETLEISTRLLGNVCGVCPSPSWNILARTWVCVSSQRWLPVCGYTTAHWPGLQAVLFDSRLKRGHLNGTFIHSCFCLPVKSEGRSAEGPPGPRWATAGPGAVCAEHRLPPLISFCLLLQFYV